MIEDVKEYVESFHTSAIAWKDVLTDEHLRLKVRGRAIHEIAEELVYQVKEAISTNLEYNAYPPLAERLIENMSNYAHVMISDDLQTVNLVNRDIAGTEADLEAGWEHGIDPDRARRARKWKYGIYIPWAEGGAGYQATAKDKPKIIADYREVIDARLRAWGDKAPYWFFLEYGTVGPYPWPTFGGSGFIWKTRLEGAHIIRRLIRDRDEAVEAQVEYSFEEVERSGKAAKVFVEERDATDLPPGFKEITVVSKLKNVSIQYRDPKGQFYKK